MFHAVGFIDALSGERFVVVIIIQLGVLMWFFEPLYAYYVPYTYNNFCKLE